MPGHPDWQSVNQQQNEALVATETQSYQLGSNTVWTGTTSSWAALVIRFKPSAGAGKLTVFWYTDSTYNTFIGADTWEINSNTGVNVRYPVQGPYAKIIMDVTGTVSMETVAWILPSQTAPDHTEYLLSAQLLAASGSVAASGTSTTYCTWLCRGLAWLSFTPDDTSGKLKIQVIATDELGGTEYTIAEISAVTETTNLLLCVPDLPLNMVVTNASATTAHSFAATLTIPVTM